jgi:hypothetical protein
LEQPDHKPETEGGGVSCISVGPMISSSPAMQLVELVCRAWKAFWANRFVTFVRRRNSLRYSLGFGPLPGISGKLLSVLKLA